MTNTYYHNLMIPSKSRYPAPIYIHAKKKIPVGLGKNCPIIQSQPN